MAGRKSLRDELGIIRRYADLTGPYFDFLKEMFESKNKKDKMWAAEQLKNAFPKFIPQQLGGLGDEPIKVQWILPSHPLPAPTQSPLRGSKQISIVTQGSQTRLGLSSDRCSAAR